MKRLSWVILVMMACCRVSQAQQRDAGMPDTVAADTAMVSAPDSTRSLQSGSSVTFTDFTVTARENNKVFVQWDASNAAPGDYFVIERGSDETHYETIGVVSAAVGTGHYELTDGAAPNGMDFYRIKYAAANGLPVYSKTMQLSLSGAVDFKFYPNPVDKLFIVRTEHTIDLQIIDAAGAVRFSKRLQSGIQAVNVSFLEKGVYVLRITDKESNRAVSHQLVKN